MKITKTVRGNALEIALEGELDSNAAPALERELEHCMEGMHGLTINLEKLNYMSSAGLRLILMAEKTTHDKGGLKITHVSEDIWGLFVCTGYSDFLDIELQDR